ncbi:hypothetical protein Dimus_034376 [Dionaea muscipula]
MLSNRIETQKAKNKEGGGGGSDDIYIDTKNRMNRRAKAHFEGKKKKNYTMKLLHLPFALLFSLISIICFKFPVEAVAAESGESVSGSSQSLASQHRHPLPLLSLRIKSNQTASSCSYTVIISTSCSSVSYTRDRISLAFGDAYGNQVYVPRLDDPSSRTFERCSADTFQINGPCTYDVCYVYLYRRGYDGWKPDTVEIYGTYTRTAAFYYKTFIPSNVWYGFNYCNGVSASPVL